MTDRTHITVILDRTGSMADIRDDVVGGFNSFLAAQQALDAPATFTLVQFDSQDPYEVVQPFGPLAQARPLTRATYVPRASTPLYDAIGRGLIDLEASLGRLLVSERPAKVVFAIVTDGHENASREFSRERVLSMISTKKSEGWSFVFLSADPTSFDDAAGLGVHDDARLLFHKTRKGNARAWSAMSSKMEQFRGGALENMHFDDKDRSDQDDAR